jgi:hypothetical protein
VTGASATEERTDQAKAHIIMATSALKELWIQVAFAFSKSWMDGWMDSPAACLHCIALFVIPFVLPLTWWGLAGLLLL